MGVVRVLETCKKLEILDIRNIRVLGQPVLECLYKHGARLQKLYFEGCTIDSNQFRDQVQCVKFNHPRLRLVPSSV